MILIIHKEIIHVSVKLFFQQKQFNEFHNINMSSITFTTLWANSAEWKTGYFSYFFFSQK